MSIPVPSSMQSALTTALSIRIHAMFDTSVVLDTYSLTLSDYVSLAERVRSHLTALFPDAEWQLETERDMHSEDDWNDYIPITNVSFLMARYDGLLRESSISETLADGAAYVLSLSDPLIYFHPWNTGVLSFTVSLDHSIAWTALRLEQAQRALLDRLESLIQPALGAIREAYVSAVTAVEAPLYTVPFPLAQSVSASRSTIAWSHRIFVACAPGPDEMAHIAATLSGLMMPTDQNGVTNMAIKPGRFIYFGSGASSIVFGSAVSMSTVDAYVRLVEIRNYLWRILYELDNSMRIGVIMAKHVKSPRDARLVAGETNSLALRVRSILQELEPYKLTFDNEKIWLMRQLDRQWMTGELVAGVQARLDSFSSFYRQTEDAMARDQDERLRTVLNLIGVVATAGAITEVINFLDPHFVLPAAERDDIFGLALFLILLLYWIAMTIIARRRGVRF